MTTFSGISMTYNMRSPSGLWESALPSLVKLPSSVAFPFRWLSGSWFASLSDFTNLPFWCLPHNRSNVHTTQISALLHICDLSIQFPIARECFRCVQAGPAIYSIPLEVDPKTNNVDDVRALNILRERCCLALRENNVYVLWNEFFLAGDKYGRDKAFVKIMSYLRSVLSLHLKQQSVLIYLPL